MTIGMLINDRNGWKADASSEQARTGYAAPYKEDERKSQDEGQRESRSPQWVESGRNGTAAAGGSARSFDSEH